MFEKNKYPVLEQVKSNREKSLELIQRVTVLDHKFANEREELAKEREELDVGLV